MSKHFIMMIMIMMRIIIIIIIIKLFHFARLSEEITQREGMFIFSS